MRGVLVLMACITLLASAALAQINPFRSSQFVLVQSDREQMTAAADTLLNERTPEEGDMAEWSNPETGSKGNIKITRVTHDPLLCVSLLYQIQLVRPKDPRLFDVRSCRTEEGVWKLVAPGSRLPDGTIIR